MVKRLLLGLCAILGLTLSAHATNTVYISHAGSGSANGSNCSNAEPYSYFNSSSNWNSSPTGVQIGPGTTIHACAETYQDSTSNDTALTFQCGTANGTSSNPITLTFDQGTTNLYNSAYWSTSNGAIHGSGCTYVVVNGDSNLVIGNQNGATPTNGTGLANTVNGFGMEFLNCTHCTVEGITIQNIYIHSNGDTSGTTSVDLELDTNSTGSLITQNTLNNAKTGLIVGTDPGGDASNVTISYNTMNDHDWGMNIGGGDSGDTINPVFISNNNITNWANWAQPSTALHQDGIILFNVGNPTAGITAYIWDNYIYGDLTTGSPTGFIYCADFSTCYLWNNVLVNTTTNHPIYGIAWLGQGSNYGKNYFVYNNTIVTSDNSDHCLNINSSGTTSDVRNNICSGEEQVYDTYTGDSGTIGAQLTTFVGLFTVSDYNVLSPGTHAYGNENNGNTATYAVWTGSPYNMDPHSTQTAPNLSSSYLIQNTSSSAYHLGTNLTSLCTGNLASLCTGAPQTFGVGGACGTGCISRPSTGAWDAGAYPFQASPPNASTPFPAILAKGQVTTTGKGAAQ